MTRMLAWAQADPALHAQAVAIMLETYGKSPVEANKPYPGMRAVLAQLADQGVPMGLCTNKPEAPTLKIIEALELGPFIAVVGGDTLPQRKPDPAPLQDCARQMGVPVEEVLYVGDREVDHAAAAAAGAPFALFTGGYLNNPLSAPAPVAQFTAWSAFFESLP